MDVHFVDSNVFYYHLLQDKVHGPRATGIISRIEAGEPAATSVVVLSELMSLFEFRVVQTRRRKDLSKAEREYVVERFERSASSLYDLVTTLVHLRKLDFTWNDAIQAFTYRTRHKLGFNDAANVAVMERHDISSIYSFDKAFDSIPGLRRKDS